MGAFYVYENHSGSLPVGAVGYEVSVDLPASYLYNLTYYTDLGGLFGAFTSSCWAYFPQPGGTYEPADLIYRGSADASVQLFDNVYGWFNYKSLSDLFRERGMGLPFNPFYLPATTGGRAKLSITNPVRFRIYNRPLGLGHTVSWTGLYFALSDECHLPLAAPEAFVGVGEGGSWSMVGAPSTFGSGGNTLPNGAPLSGRNRVQLLS